MPLINVQPRDMQDGTRITYFNDSVGTSSTTYTFNTDQEMIILRNKGSKDLNYTIGVTSGVLGQGETIKLNAIFSFVVLSASQGTQAFEIISDEAGTSGILSEVVTTPKNTVVAFGDSITQFNGQGDDVQQQANYYVLSSFGYLTWANVLLGQRLRMVKNAGIGGNTTAQMLARISTDVIAYNPGYVIVCGGANDIMASTPLAAIQENLLAIYNTLLAKGITVIAGTVPPNNTISATQMKSLISLNQWIKSLSGNLKNFIVCDWFEDLVNPATGTYATNMVQTDGIHPSTQGFFKMGSKLATVLQNIVPSVNVFSGANVNDPNNPFSNPYLLGGTTIAPSWSSYAPGVTLTESKVARSSLGLEWQQETNTGAVGVMNLYAQTLTGFTAGKKVSAYIEFEIDAAASAIDNYTGMLGAYDGSNNLLVSSYSLAMSGTTDTAIRFPQDKVSGIMYIPRFVIPTGTTKLYFQFTSKQIGSFRVGRTRVVLE